MAEGSLDQQIQDLQRSSETVPGQISSDGLRPEQAHADGDEYTPGSPAETPLVPVSNQSSMQPESENFPEPLDSTSNTPLLGPQDNQDSVNQSPNNILPNLDNASNLDDPDNHVPDLEVEDAQVLTCHEVDGLNVDLALHEWTVFHHGTNSGEVCLAEDGMPFIEEPLDPHENQCFMLEVPLSRQDLLRWSQSDHPEELAQVASASKRARAEVQLKDLNFQDRKLFAAAKDAEISCWLQTSALKPVLRRHLNP
jgi:hypothetical protein